MPATSMETSKDPQAASYIERLETRNSTHAKSFDEAQREESVWAALKGNKTALGWCIWALFSCTNFGYDGLAGTASYQVLQVAISLPQFREAFGERFGHAYVVPAAWQLGWNATSLAAIIVGALTAGFISNRFGRQTTYGLGYILAVSGCFAQFFARGSRPVFLVGKLLTGIPLGVFQTLTVSYTSEVAPLALRGIITAATMMSFTIGQFLAYVVLKGVSTITGARAYQIMFAVQWSFAGIALLFLPFFIESPYYLVSKGRLDHARRNIIKLYGTDCDVDSRIANIQSSLSSATEDGSGFAACFSAEHRLRTLTAIGVFFTQSASGSTWVIGYIGYFLQLGGVPAAKTFDVTLGIQALTLVGNILGWPLLEYFGRRRTFVTGTSVLSAALLIIGIIALVQTKVAIWVQVAFMGVWCLVYPASVGSLSFPLAAEIPSSSVRSPTLSLCVAVNSIGTLVWALSISYLVNPDEADLQGKVGFIFGGMMAVCALLLWAYCPETKGRTFAELDELFWSGTKARNFHKVDLERIKTETKEQANN